MGSELLTTGSVIAAFLAGGVALFAPCCIVFLAPSYLAAAVTQAPGDCDGARRGNRSPDPMPSRSRTARA